MAKKMLPTAKGYKGKNGSDIVSPKWFAPDKNQTWQNASDLHTLCRYVHTCETTFHFDIYIYID